MAYEVKQITSSFCSQVGGFPSGSVVKNSPATLETQETWVLSPGQEDPLDEEMINQLQCSCWQNPMDSGAWWATVHGVEESRTQCSNLSTHSMIIIIIPNSQGC